MLPAGLVEGRVPRLFSQLFCRVVTLFGMHPNPVNKGTPMFVCNQPYMNEFDTYPSCGLLLSLDASHSAQHLDIAFQSPSPTFIAMQADPTRTPAVLEHHHHHHHHRPRPRPHHYPHTPPRQPGSQSPAKSHITSPTNPSTHSPPSLPPPPPPQPTPPHSTARSSPHLPTPHPKAAPFYTLPILAPTPFNPCLLSTVAAISYPLSYLRTPMPLRRKNHSHSPKPHVQLRQENNAPDSVLCWEEKKPVGGTWKGLGGGADVVVQSIEEDEGGQEFCRVSELKGTTMRRGEKRNSGMSGSDDDGNDDNDNDDCVEGDRKKRRKS